jgi:hypothetical protein
MEAGLLFQRCYAMSMSNSDTLRDFVMKAVWEETLAEYKAKLALLRELMAEEE